MNAVLNSGPVPDPVTYTEVVASLRGGLMRFVRLSENADDFEAYIRRALCAGDYSGVHRARGKTAERGEVPAWERAFALFLSTRDFVRALAGRTRDGSLRKVGNADAKKPPGPVRATAVIVTMLPTLPPAPEPEPKPVERVNPRADIAGYEYDPSWTNGGMSAQAEDRTETPRGMRERHVRGIEAFRSVGAIGGIPELAWFFCGSAFELGMASSFDGMLGALLIGRDAGEGSNGASPRGPGELARIAAAHQRRILGILGALEHRHQLTLRIAYTDQRYPAGLVRDYGFGVAPIVWRAMHDAGENVPGPRTLERLVEAVRRDWPSYAGAVEGCSEELSARIRRAAELLLDTAHLLYEARSRPAPTPLQRIHAAFKAQGRALAKPRRRRRKGRAKEAPHMISAGAKGRSKRQLRSLHDVQEARASSNDEPRAA